MAADAAYYVATSGNDATGNGSATSPWQTIQKAAGSVPGGATVHVAPGTYDERVTIPAACSGAAGAPTRFSADGAVVVSKGFVVNSSYTDLSGFQISGGATAGMGERVGQVDIAGGHDTFTGFRIHDIAAGCGFALHVGASYDTITDFAIDDVQWSGIATSNTYNAGSDHTTISHGTIAHWRGRCGIELTGDYQLVDGVTFVGGPSGSAAGSLDGDGIRVNYSTGSVIRDCTIRDLWEWYNDAQHTDCIQMWVAVHDLLIDRCTLGTWQPGPPPDQRGGLAQEIGPSQIIMCGTVSTNSHVDFTLQNSLLLGQCGTGASIVTAKNSGASIDITLLNNTFWSSYPSLNSCDSARLRNNIFRSFYLYPANRGGIDADYDIYCWVGGSGSNNVPSSEGPHSLGRSYATRVDPGALFVNPDVSAATDYGRSADFRPLPTSPSVGAAEAAAATTVDISGAPRSSPPDIGAYEYFPRVTIVAPAFSTAVSASASFPLSWSSTSPTSSPGIAGYLVDCRVVPATTWIAWGGLRTATRASFTGKPGRTYQFRARAKGLAGNLMPYSDVVRTVVPLNDTSATFTGAWSSTRQTGAFLREVKSTRSRGATATFRATGKNFSLLVTEGPRRSQARVYVDGRLVRRLDTKATSTRHRRLILVKSFTKAGKHVIRVVNSATARRALFQLDGLAAAR